MSNVKQDRLVCDWMTLQDPPRAAPMLITTNSDKAHYENEITLCAVRTPCQEPTQQAPGRVTHKDARHLFLLPDSSHGSKAGLLAYMLT